MNRLIERHRTKLFSSLVILAALYVCWAVACTYEENTKVSFDGNNPPTFRLYGSGHQMEFAVSEVHPDNHAPPAYRNPDKDIELWKIVPEAEPPPKAWDYPQITYGNVPRGYRQELPKGGAPPALVEGKTYEAGGAAYGANGGSVLFTIRDGKAVIVPKPNNR